MQSLGKSMVARERDAIKIGIAQCSLAELIGGSLDWPLVMESDGSAAATSSFCCSGSRGSGGLSRDQRFSPAEALRLLSNPE